MADFEPKQFGKYFLLEKLAVGGMAEIYKAKTFGVDGFEKDVAIKRILPHCSADKDFISMLIDEAKLSVLLSHANIVQVYDLGKVGDDYFISMEFIHGVNLKDIVYHCRETKHPMPVDLAVYVVSETCKGLDYAHRKTDQTNQSLNIVHRDISPQNILISYDGEVKIGDFGIAKAAMNISHTMAGILKGKIAYMSPEQAMGRPVDKRTDIFSLGILFYEMLTGTKLFTGESQFEVLKKIRTTKITVESLPDSVPAILKPALAKALAYGAEDRYQNAGDLQIELTKFLYSTYSDFSPRKLSTFIRQLFIGDIKKEEAAIDEDAVFEQRTGSINATEGAKQLEIVHRDVPPDTVSTPGFQKKTAAVKKGSLTEVETPAEKRKRPWLVIAAAVVSAAALAWLFFRFVPQARFWEASEKAPIGMGSIFVDSEPEGASVFIDGRDTGRTTPALIDGLAIGESHTVSAAKEDFETAEKAVTVASTDRIDVLFALPQPTGILNIVTEPPGATVTINGIHVEGTTPAAIAKLKPGRYEIVLTLSGYENWNGAFDVEAGESEPVNANLKPKLAAAAEPPAQEPLTPKAPPPAPAVPPTTPAVLTAAAATMRITSNPPGARITIDGKNTGQKTPAQFGDLKIGSSYNIRLDLDGYKSVFRKKAIKKSSETVVTDLSKEEKPSEATAPPIAAPQQATGGTGAIRVTSSPSGADVYINDENKGTTPLTVNVPAGTARVMVNKEGLAKVSRQVTVKAGQTTNVTDIELGDLYGEVSISSDPPHAQVIFDGQNFPATTPVTVRKVRKDKSHTITVQLQGYKSWSKTFTMDEGHKSFNVTLGQ